MVGGEPTEILGKNQSNYVGEDILRFEREEEVKLKLERDSELLDRWEQWLDIDPNIANHLGHELPWKDSQKHKDASNDPQLIVEEMTNA